MTTHGKHLSGLFAMAMLSVIAHAAPLALHTSGNKILNSKNEPVRLRGVNVASLECTSDGHGYILKTVEVAIHDWHVNTIRLPLTQDRWFGKMPEQSNNPAAYRALVHQITDYCATNNCYIILDLHWSDCNVWGRQVGQHSMPDKNSVEFWKDFAPQFANRPEVIFDLYNEPHDISWEIWRDGGVIKDVPNVEWQKRDPATFQAVGMQTLLDTVRVAGAKNVVIVGGLRWAYDFPVQPLTDPHGRGVIYASHCYDNKGESVDTWAKNLEQAAGKFPVIVSEFGGAAKPGKVAPQANWLFGVLGALESHQWSWLAWDMHTVAGPTLISDWDYTPSPDFGVYVKEVLAGGAVPKE